MSEQPQVLVLTARNDAQLSMLKNIPHVVENDMSAFERAKADAAVILHWSGDRELLRTAFLASPKVRWVHSRAAGLDHILFPELVDSDIPLTNGRGVFSQTLGEFALAAILYFAKDFPRMLRNKAAERWEQFDVEEIAGQTVGIVGYGDIGRAVARRNRLLFEHVQSRAFDPLRAQRPNHRRLVNHRAAPQVQNDPARLHGRKLFIGDEM